MRLVPVGGGLALLSVCSSPAFSLHQLGSWGLVTLGIDGYCWQWEKPISWKWSRNQRRAGFSPYPGFPAYCSLIGFQNLILALGRALPRAFLWHPKGGVSECPPIRLHRLEEEHKNSWCATWISVLAVAFWVSLSSEFTLSLFSFYTFRECAVDSEGKLMFNFGITIFAFASLPLPIMK